MGTPVHLPTDLSLRDAAKVVRHVVRVLADSNRTEDIMIAEEMTSRAQLSYLLRSGIMERGDGPALMRERPDLADVDLDALRRLPARTLGGSLVRFLDDNGLSSDVYGYPCQFIDDPDMAYLMRRIRQSHDLWHLLTGFTIQGHDEILLHTFQLAQTGFPSSVALLVLGGLKHVVLEARVGALRSGFLAAYQRGLEAEPFVPVYWERYLEDDLEDVRARLRIRPWTEADHAATGRFRVVGPRVRAAA